jgi:hypothetical protein
MVISSISCREYFSGIIGISLHGVGLQGVYNMIEEGMRSIKQNQPVTS